MTLQDIVKGLDPTGFNSISGAEVAQMIDVCSPADDRGLTLWTEDTAGVPDVPNPELSDAYNKFKRYLWIRQMATTTKIYAWNDTAASDATYLKWLDLTDLSISAGTVTNSMLAGGITNDKLVSIEYAKVSGVPTSFAPSGAAGGDLAGTYPNPTIGAGAVTATKLGPLVGAKVVQEVFNYNAAWDSTNAAIPIDDSIPQNTEGKEYLTKAITPTALTNYLQVHFCCFAAHGLDQGSGSIALFYDSVANCLQATNANFSGAGGRTCMSLLWIGLVSDLIGALAEITFKIRFGPSANFMYMNGNASATIFSTGAKAFLVIKEFRP